MKKAVMDVKFKNNKKKKYDVILTINSDDAKYIVYTLGEIKNEELVLYAAKLENDVLVEITDLDTKEMIQKVLDNFNKGV